MSESEKVEFRAGVLGCYIHEEEHKSLPTWLEARLKNRFLIMDENQVIIFSGRNALRKTDEHGIGLLLPDMQHLWVQGSVVRGRAADMIIVPSRDAVVLDDVLVQLRSTISYLPIADGEGHEMKTDLLTLVLLLQEKDRKLFYDSISHIGALGRAAGWDFMDRVEVADIPSTTAFVALKNAEEKAMGMSIETISMKKRLEAIALENKKWKALPRESLSPEAVVVTHLMKRKRPLEEEATTGGEKKPRTVFLPPQMRKDI